MKFKMTMVWLFCFLFLNFYMIAIEINSKNETIKRFVFAMGANNGGPKRVQLQYAQTDASSMVKILQEMGGVTHEDCTMLSQPNKRVIQNEMRNLDLKVREARKQYSRVEVIFYYSGHSDEESLLLGEERLPYTEFRDFMNQIDANVKIAILDSCSSGTFARFKGVKSKPPFILDNANNMKGFAIMTSCSANELSQESDYLKGSFFTHNLLTGLRGAADQIQDGRVTLNEAYQFAFGQTLDKTDESLGGPQHPYYNIQMDGTGDVVMTDIRESSCQISIDQDIFGELMIWDHNNMLVIEIRKMKGRNIMLGLDKGDYRIMNIFGGKVFEAAVSLKENKQLFVTHNEFKKSELIKTRSRGKEIVGLELSNQQSSFYPFVGLKSRSLNILGESGIGPVFHIGVSQKKGFALGLFGMMNNKKGYGGLSFEYSFARDKPIHFKLGMLLTLFYANINNNDALLEAEMQVLWRVKKNLRLGVGFAIPFSGNGFADSDFPSLILSIQLGR